MNIQEYNKRFTLIFSQIESHCAMMETKEYKSCDELSRDMAIGIELAQQYFDTLGEAIEDRDAIPLSDYVPMELK